MLNIEQTQVIEEHDWSKFVSETYGRPYNLQQQDGCMERGTINLTVPAYYDKDPYANDAIPESVNGEEMGVSFKGWLARNPKQILQLSKKKSKQTQMFELKLFWERNFYPDLQMVANDLHDKGLLQAGEYVIDIDW